MLILFILVFFIWYKLPGNIHNATNQLFSRFELGSPGSTNQNTIEGGITVRDNLFKDWLTLTIEAPFFGKGQTDTRIYTINHNAIGLAHNLFLTYSVTYGLIYLILFIIMCILAFQGFWKVKNTQWGLAFLAAYLSLFPPALAHGTDPWLFFITIGIGMAIKDQYLPQRIVDNRTNHQAISN